MKSWIQRWLVIGLVTLALILFAGCSNQSNQQPDNGISSTLPVATSASGTPLASARLSQIIPARTGSSIAYDEKRGQVILFGGDSYNDTWTWDGHSWTQLFPASVPPVRSDASMAYDAATGQVILFGGVGTTGTALADTWAWDGANWLPLNPAVSPPARAQASLTYDAAHQRLVLFGGTIMGNQHATPVANDTWTWDGKTWRQQNPQASPPARSQASMAYDFASREVLLFGGTTGKGVLNDTWAWNGASWSKLHPSTLPAARAGAGFAFDSEDAQAVLFGGASAANDLSDTWIWNGSNWSQHTTQGGPTGPYAQAVYDAAQHSVIAYIVQVQNKTLGSSQTWLWNGKAWNRVQ